MQFICKMDIEEVLKTMRALVEANEDLRATNEKLVATIAKFENRALCAEQAAAQTQSANVVARQIISEQAATMSLLASRTKK